jgi:hypothetical protein
MKCDLSQLLQLNVSNLKLICVWLGIAKISKYTKIELINLILTRNVDVDINFFPLEIIKYYVNLFDGKIFNHALKSVVTIELVTSCGTKAGYCSINHATRTAKISLSKKLCFNSERIRDVLIHELCHAAQYLLREPYKKNLKYHGIEWKMWTNKANTTFPELPLIDEYHNYITGHE